jgi:flagellar protein FlaG
VDTPAIPGSEPQVSAGANGQATRAAVEAAVAAVKDRVQTNASNLEFSIDDESGETVVRVKDAQTNEVIRQYPSEEMLVIARNLARLENVLVDKKA